jgi:hypothetical protein
VNGLPRQFLGGVTGPPLERPSDGGSGQREFAAEMAGVGELLERSRDRHGGARGRRGGASGCNDDVHRDDRPPECGPELDRRVEGSPGTVAVADPDEQWSTRQRRG